MKHIQTLLFLLLLFPPTLLAIQLENRMPESVWQAEISLKIVPVYTRAFNGYGEEAPLQNLILLDRGLMVDNQGVLTITDSISAKIKDLSWILPVR